MAFDYKKEYKEFYLPLKAIRQYLSCHSPEQWKELMQMVISRYDKFEKDQPWIGGKANVLWDKMYGSVHRQ